jgi:GTP cyclohydrolase I
MSISNTIRKRLEDENIRYYAGDNIADYIFDDEKQELIDELTTKFEGVLDSLVIDRNNDPNSMDTPRRLAKMYINELMEGRYNPPPNVTAFPNDDPRDRYAGLLNVRAEILSMCSHHHQPVKGVCYIGLLPSTRVIGLSKYVRIAQWCARRGTLQEELARQIADKIMHYTGSEDVGVYIQATHGCMENRGVLAHSSLTQTTVLHGQFYNPSVKEEWTKNIQMQQATVGNR